MKKHNRNKHQHSRVDESEENLRGRLRELQKELEKEKRYSRSLEKRLSSKNEKVPDVKEETYKLSDSNCQNCGKGTMVEHTINSPTKEIVWAVCDTCKHRERRK